jgi:WD40 repeat protein
MLNLNPSHPLSAHPHVRNLNVFRWLTLLLFTLPAHLYPVYGVAKFGAEPILTLNDANRPDISADGRRIAVLPEIGKVEVYDVAQKRKLRSFSVPNASDHRLSAAGDRVAILGSISHPSTPGHYTAEVKLWIYDVESGRELQQLSTDVVVDGRQGASLSIGSGEYGGSISSDLTLLADSLRGDQLASSTKPGILLWDVEKRALVKSFGRSQGRDSWRVIRLTPDGRVLATTVSNLEDERRSGTVVWETGTGRELLRLPFSCWRLALSADGRRLVTIRNDPTGRSSPTTTIDITSQGKVQVKPLHGILQPGWPGRYVTEIWGLGAGKLLQQVGSSYSKVPPIGDGALSPDGKLLATVSSQYVLVWEAGSGRILAAQRHVKDANYDVVKGVLFSDDGRLLVMSSMGEVVKVWLVMDVLRMAKVDDEALRKGNNRGRA